MKTVPLKGYPRTEFGKAATGRLRRTGFVPCELYGAEGNKHFQAFYTDFKDIVYTAEKFKVEVQLDGKSVETVIKDIQYHPMSDDITHVDFMEVSASKALKMELPIRFTGNSIGVREGGKLVRKMRTLTVKGLASDMPEAVELDISNLGMGKNIRVSDVKPIQGVQVMNQRSNPIATINVPRGMKGKQEEAAETKGKKK